MSKQNTKLENKKKSQVDLNLEGILRNRISSKEPKCEEILDTLSSKHSTQMVMELLFDCFELSNGGIAESDGKDLHTDPSLFTCLSEYKLRSEISLNRGCSGLRMFNLFLTKGKLPRIVFDIFYKGTKLCYSDLTKTYEATYLLDTLGIDQFVLEPSQRKWLTRLHSRTGQKVSIEDMTDELFVDLQLLPDGKELVLHLSECKKENCNCFGSRKLVGNILRSIRDWIKLDMEKISIFGYLCGMPMLPVREFIKTAITFQNEIELSTPTPKTS